MNMLQARFLSLLAPLLICASLTAFGCAPLNKGGESVAPSAKEKADFHYKLATGLIYEKRPIAALRELEVSISLDPTHSRAHYLKGFIYMGRNNFGEASVHFHRAIKLHPKLYEAHNGLAGCYLALKRWRDALDTLDVLLKDPLNPTPWLAHNNAGWAYHNLGDRSRAVHHLETAVLLKPEFCLGYYNLGIVLKKRKRYDQARRRFEQARKRCPKYAPALLELGDVYLTTARFNKARDAYKRCVKVAEGTLIGDRCVTRQRNLP